MFSRSTSLLRSSLRTSVNTPLSSRSFASTTLLRNSTANASQSTHDAQQARDDGEQKIYDKLKNKFSPKTLDVMDVSGGCGSFYAIHISSPLFKGLTTIKQHRLVNECLKEEVKDIHGLQLKTVPEE